MTDNVLMSGKVNRMKLSDVKLLDMIELIIIHRANSMRLIGKLDDVPVFRIDVHEEQASVVYFADGVTKPVTITKSVSSPSEVSNFVTDAVGYLGIGSFGEWQEGDHYVDEKRVEDTPAVSAKFLLKADGNNILCFSADESEQALALVDRLIMTTGFRVITVTSPEGKEEMLLLQVTSGLFSVHGRGLFFDTEPRRIGSQVCKSRLESIMAGEGVSLFAEPLDLKVTVGGNTVFLHSDNDMYEYALAVFIHNALAPFNEYRECRWITDANVITVTRVRHNEKPCWDVVRNGRSYTSTSPTVMVSMLSDMAGDVSGSDQFHGYASIRERNEGGFE